MDFLDKILPVNELDTKRVKDVYDRLSTILSEQYPDIDTQPNSVFGDTILRPLSYLVGALEEAQNCVFSDLDLRNLAAGQICDCDFAEDYIRNLGVDAPAELPTVGTVRLTFNTDELREFPNTKRVGFDNQTMVKFLVPRSSNIIILPTTAQSAYPEDNIFKLKKIRTDRFIVDIPILGPPGADIESGEDGLTDLEDNHLVSVVLSTPLRNVTLPQTLQETVPFTKQLFPSSSLTTRSSIISFFTNRLGNLGGVSPVMPGDTEMQRGSTNLFGVASNSTDIYLKGNARPVEGTIIVPLTHSDLSAPQGGDSWRGVLNFGGDIPLRINSVRTLTQELIESVKTNESEGYSIVGTSKDSERFPNMSGAFTEYEDLGIIIPDGEPSIVADNIPKDSVSSLSSTDAEVLVSGVYKGGCFSPGFKNKLVIGFTSETECVVTNTVTGEKTDMTLSPDGTDYVLDIDSSVEGERWLYGLTVRLELNGETDIGGKQFTVEYEGVGGYVVVNYLYDPIIREAHGLIDHDLQRGVFDLALRSPHPVFLDKLTIEYRTGSGKWTDVKLARDEILEYVNSTVYPALIEDSALSDAILYAGAAGVHRITKEATLWQTLADLYTMDGRDFEHSNSPPDERSNGDFVGYKIVDWSDMDTAFLVDPVRDLRVGPRSVQFNLTSNQLYLTERRTA